MIIETARNFPWSVASTVKKLCPATLMIFALVLLMGCRNDCGELDEDVFINKAIENFILSRNPDLSNHFSASGEKFTITLPFNTPEELRKINPDCCSFSYRGEDGWLPKWRKRFFTDYAGIVASSGVERRHFPDRTEDRKFRTSVPMNSCAEPIPWSAITPGIFD